MNSFSCCDSLSFVVRNSRNCLCASLSHIFDRMGNNDIGLLLAGTSELPSLGTGITSAIFYALGKAAIWNELFTSLEITGVMLSQLSFRTRAEILSYPGALSAAKLLITDLTSVSFMYWNSNPSYSACSSFSILSSLGPLSLSKPCSLVIKFAL